MDAAGELIDASTLAAEIEDADLWVGYTTIEARLGVWLYRIIMLVFHSYFLTLRMMLRSSGANFAVQRTRCMRTLFLQ